MRIWAISDLHLEFYKSAQELFNLLVPRLPKADVLILAGDIGYAVEKFKFHPQVNHRTNLTDLLHLFKARYVPGNHEYYPAVQFDRAGCLKNLQEVCDETKMTLLDKSTCEIDGVEFIGTTLWSSIDYKTSKALTDCQLVFPHQLDYLEEFMNCYTWLRSELAKSAVKPRVVITHHLPTDRLVSPLYADHPYNSGFATNVLDKLSLRNVKLWVCGHSHMQNTTKYGDTRLVLNPVGYPNEKNTLPFSDKVYDVNK